ncbi:putative phosphatidate phosphatase [Helianthus annuus]|uniref:phosphatidate phosphatase n=1 Tax=Helianthus annuus TaxID=4232 RepID=A0A251TEX9_HELAN|nr:phosphatidate phosphatase PAH1 [Helianthus annuus]XP_021994603.1 phosphatidate phosphatase PAH1 [Helianthus annuus]KAF5783962.1 putative phosphatidate phosphatase [Helianthus annuus]KAJ0519171.1 putative phosphatidate phosphatase [Helianthus annuus]KAJ0690966.1 putative phosphatidate phosphatase [Helianthus annuus]KAJ0872634.1 putative phosphatidate phosphatase [Helianthus annuus]
MISRVGSYLSQSVYSVATPFHPFGGAVDIIVVQQQDGSFRSTPWYVRFGKFQGVLKGAEKIVKIEVNGVEADFHMYLDNSGEAYFIKEIDPEKDSDVNDSESVLESRKDDFAPEKNNNVEVQFQEDHEFQGEQSPLDGSIELSDFGSKQFDNLENDLGSNSSEVVLFSVDGQILSAPITSMEENTENVQLSTPQFHLGPIEGPEFEGDLDLSNEATWTQYLNDISRPKDKGDETQTVVNLERELSITSLVDDSPSDVKKDDVFKSCLALNDLGKQENGGDHDVDVEGLQVGNESEGVENVESLKVEVKSVESSKLEVETESTGVNVNSLDIEHKVSDVEIVKDHDGEEFERGENSPYGPEHEDDDNDKFDGSRRTRIEISLCGNLLRPGMGSSTASETFNAHRISEEEFKISAASIIKNDSLIIKIEDKYFTWDKVAHIVLGTAAYGLEMHVDPNDAIPVDWNEETSLASTPSGRRWWLWPIAFRRVKTLDHNNSNLSGEDVFLDSESVFDSPQSVEKSPQSPQKQLVRTQNPTSEQISSLKLKDGQNMVSFVFSTRVLGVQKVDAHIYLWKWNARIVISDVDGTITKSDVLGQFMPLVGRDWSQSGVAQLFSAIKENGYQLLFLSARAIVQAYITRNFLINLKQDGKALPNGPVVISPDGLFPSLYREVIRRAPHEFKIACLEDIRALFPADYNPFYAGFGNRDTDELSYRKIGIPKGKIFIINPKGEVAISHRIDMKGKSYTSLHTLVNDMFPPTSMVEQEDYNSWNYWKMPMPDVDL